ncbi:MAG TPA: FeoB-associated Cys-rich membrane protein, partial [Ktedonobacterales bacterium]|nr:FeoB-associated Cys-rich membrane protein [Ktedonobacterales bacterium]
LAYVGYRFGDQVAGLSSAFHGLDVVIVVLFVAAVAYYIYRHIKKDRRAASQPDPDPEPLGQQSRW